MTEPQSNLTTNANSIFGSADGGFRIYSPWLYHKQPDSRGPSKRSLSQLLTEKGACRSLCLGCRMLLLVPTPTRAVTASGSL